MELERRKGENARHAALLAERQARSCKIAPIIEGMCDIWAWKGLRAGIGLACACAWAWACYGNNDVQEERGRALEASEQWRQKAHEHELRVQQLEQRIEDSKSRCVLYPLELGESL